MKCAVVVFPGSNCDRDVQVALRDTLQSEPTMVWHEETILPSVDLFVIPGGFSFGDYLRSGCIAANSPIVAEIVKRAQSGVPTIGICNGFQVLCESGLLPGALIRNAGLHFVCKQVSLRVENANSTFTKDYKFGELIQMPIAHNNGNYITDSETCKRLQNENRIAFKYCDDNGKITENANPNGSLHNIAGIFNEKGNVLGMMPHPERATDEKTFGSDGRKIFEGLQGSILNG